MDVTKKDVSEKFDGIVITHFVNPHLFWFRTESSFLLNDDFHELESKINHYYVNNSKSLLPSEYKHQVGEVSFIPKLKLTIFMFVK